MQPVVTTVVSLLVTSMSCTKTTEPIAMLFGIWTLGTQGTFVSWWGGRSHCEKGHFWQSYMGMPNLPMVDVLNII